MALGFVDQRLQHQPLRAPPVAVVDGVRVAGHQLVLEVGGLPVEGDRLDGAVGAQHDGAARGLVAAAGLHPHVPVLDDVDAADAVLAADRVQALDRGGRAHRLPVDRDHVAAPVAELDVARGVGRRLRGAGPPPHPLVRLGRRDFELVPLERDVQQVGVHGVGRCVAALALDGDAVLRGIGQELLAGVEVPLAPRGDDPDVRIERVRPELEAHLVVALAGGAVGDGVGAGALRDRHEVFGDQGAGDGGPQQVLAFVEGVGAEHREHEIPGELLAHVLDEDLLHPQRLGLAPGRLQLLALPEVGGEGDDLASVPLLQPLQDDGGIEAAGVGEHDFPDVGHGVRGSRMPVRVEARMIREARDPAAHGRDGFCPVLLLRVLRSG